MSKESKRRDRWRQLYQATADRPETWCKSCGYFPVVNDGAHRDDCAIAGANAPRCDCGEPIFRAESRAAGQCGQCLECRLFGPPP